MSLNRRIFLRSLGLGAAGLAIAAKVSAATIHTLVGPAITKDAAIKRLVAFWNDYVKLSGRCPTVLYLQADLYDAFKSELTPLERFVPGGAHRHLDALKFKVATAHRLPERGWGVEGYHGIEPHRTS